ncbi:TetR family transcriptional regulator [Bradyrhizobium sp. U87765 SZCCT0131]|uniref:TetR/AcrR family transcriptional regulator n=1 Tax=unclassified Bradyrhizobium TaxID=2631580 RepID=UPI001BA8DF12|nr:MULTISPECIES: TetR/AcrR family transcriptional regulator [unclassified Bradyrhizobium]MBR1222001.1 TetR family transcriptional regulator [Bradyrhizobium sp. U87765 SZCCT0131]MBR1263801.1 TetR family transcriptional regulator [Bradyrhizobium sp. U87765 SZCCT0134]MBR1302629.1 TetR family transcriptional regulator [Bradyrhizobium sp. U87765 SZCCT0110]MBR1320051.1 TetR family transcriptional regulator [Bradyrhizobium sp. U87765 SZCCT0109]MBR1348836.1 TetR family transcriptional regulator [Brady
MEQAQRAAGMRARLLESAARVLVTTGVHALTLDAVAREARVSKGGLLHHFSTRAELLQALLEDSYARCLSKIDELAADDPDDYGRFTRAYIRASLASDLGTAQATVVMALLLDPALRADWLLRVESLLQKDITETDQALAKILRLAADGLWLSDAFTLHRISPAERAELEERLVALTRPARRPLATAGGLPRT